MYRPLPGTSPAARLRISHRPPSTSSASMPAWNAWRASMAGKRSQPLSKPAPPGPRRPSPSGAYSLDIQELFRADWEIVWIKGRGLGMGRSPIPKPPHTSHRGAHWGRYPIHPTPCPLPARREGVYDWRAGAARVARRTSTPADLPRSPDGGAGARGGAIAGLKGSQGQKKTPNESLCKVRARSRCGRRRRSDRARPAPG